MKIYFDGCSWTYGGGLVERREQDRFTAVVCRELGVKEYNFSLPKSSNDRIVRQLLTENDISEYDYAVIQMTYSSRLEYYDESKKDNRSKGWMRIANQDIKPCKKGREFSDEQWVFWNYYYKNVFDETYFNKKEEIQYKTIRNHCKINNVPLLLMTVNNWDTKLKFDIELEHTHIPRLPCNHPNSLGHRVIADEILAWLTKHK